MAEHRAGKRVGQKPSGPKQGGKGPATKTGTRSGIGKQTELVDAALKRLEELEKPRKNAQSNKPTVAPHSSNGLVTLTCEGITVEGKGLCNWQGALLEVAGVLPGEVFKANVVRRKYSSEVRVMHIEKASPDRAKPPCPYYEACGGCQLQHMSVPAQGRFKMTQVQNALGQYGEVLPILTMAKPERYRNKSHTTFGMTTKGQIIAGIYAQNTHKLVPIDQCLVQSETADAISATVKSMLKSFKLLPYDEDSGQGLVRHVLIKTGYHTKEVMVVLVVAHHVVPSKSNFVKALIKAHPEVTTVVLNINAQRTSMVLGPYDHILYGKGTIEDIQCGKRFRISPKSFYQINPQQTERLYSEAIRMAGLTGKETVVDAYCGIGTMGIIASAKAAQVIGIELNEDAVIDAQINADLNNVKNIRFVQADAGAHLVKMARKSEKVDVLIMDPPRSGSNETFLSSLVTLGPKTVVYVSCNVQTQARDLAYLTANGYEVCEIQPVDMFGMTWHVECVVLLQLK